MLALCFSWSASFIDCMKELSSASPAHRITSFGKFCNHSISLKLPTGSNLAILTSSHLSSIHSSLGSSRGPLDWFTHLTSPQRLQCRADVDGLNHYGHRIAPTASPTYSSSPKDIGRNKIQTGHYCPPVIILVRNAPLMAPADFKWNVCFIMKNAITHSLHENIEAERVHRK